MAVEAQPMSKGVEQRPRVMNFYQSTEAITVSIFGSKRAARTFNRAILIFEMFERLSAEWPIVAPCGNASAA
jgi:hypothetical protein